MDPDNPVVRLCVEGMQAEARSLFLQAWTARQDDFDACIAAHYVAGQQEQPEGALRWNQVALDRADAVGDDRLRSFYPSLYLNPGWAHEQLGNRLEAERCYEQAASRLDRLQAGPYRDVVQTGIATGLERTAQPNE